MKKSIKNVVALILVFALSVCLCSCRASEKVSYNLSKEADDFGITRKITVINIRDNSVLYEIIAKCALQNEGNNELSIISFISVSGQLTLLRTYQELTPTHITTKSTSCHTFVVCQVMLRLKWKSDKGERI